MATENDHAVSHPFGVHMDVQHACPDCPSPLAAGLAIAPNPFCSWCRGTGLLSTADLARWERAQWGAARVGRS